MLGGSVGSRVGPRRMRGNRTIVDDAAALRLLGFHDSDRLLRAEERPEQVNVEHRFQFFNGQIFEWNRRCPGTGVVEQKIQSTEHCERAGKQIRHGIRIGDVGLHDQRTASGTGLVRHLTQQLRSAACQDDAVVRLQQRERGGLADAATSASNDCNACVVHQDSPSVKQSEVVLYQSIRWYGCDK